MKSAVLCGNPKPASRTLQAATDLAASIGLDDPEVFDVVELGPGLLRWGDPDVQVAIDAVQSSDVLIVASPTFKATYTGLLKLFLDAMPSGALTGTVAIPLMVGAGPAHALAPELHLRPVLVELGASCPLSSLYLLDSALDAGPDPMWLGQARRCVGAVAAQAVVA